MKKKIRGIFISSITFALVASFYPGFSFSDIKTLLLASAVFALLNLFIKPILKFFSIPFNLLTFGLFSLFVNVIIIYLVAAFVTDFKIVSFDLPAVTLLGINFPGATISPFFSALLASTILSFITSFFLWLL